MQKIAIWAPSHTLSGYIFATKTRIDNRKKNLLSSDMSSIYLHNMVNLGLLTAEICWRVWGTPTNFNGFCVLTALLHGIHGRQPNFAALNRGRHRCSAGRPSRMALAHISSLLLFSILMLSSELWRCWLDVRKSIRPVKVELGIVSEYNHVLANISRSRYVAMATQPVHQLQIRPIVHNYGASATTHPSYTRVRAIVWACGRGQTDRHTHTHTHTHRRAWPQYISRGLRLTRNVKKNIKVVRICKKNLVGYFEAMLNLHLPVDNISAVASSEATTVELD